MTTATIPTPTRPRHRRGPRQPRYAHCTGCGKEGRTEAHGDYQCKPCREINGTTRPVDLQFYALTDGCWIRRGLIWHWQPNPGQDTPA